MDVSSTASFLDAGYIASGDPRLKLRSLIIRPEPGGFNKLAENHPGYRPAVYFTALDFFKGEEPAKAVKFINSNYSQGTPSRANPAMDALLALSGFVAENGALNKLSDLKRSIDMGPIELQYMALSYLEQRIYELDKNDRGAEEKEEPLRGPAGWMLNRLDDAAIIIRWLVFRILNVILNLTRPQRRKTYCGLIDGDLWHGLYNYAKAREAYEKAHAADPANPEPLESLTRLSLIAGDLESASAYFAKLENTLDNEDDPFLAKLKADIRLAQGNYAEAFKLYNGVMESFPHDIMAHYRLGLCYLRLEKADKASEWFIKSLSQPNAGLLRRRIETFERLVTIAR